MMNVRTNPLQPSQRLIWWSGLFVAVALAVGGYLANFTTEGFIACNIVLFGILLLRDRHTRSILSVAGRIVENSTTVLYRLAAEPSLPMTYISRNISKLGYDPSQFLASPDFYRSLVHPDDRASVAGFTQRLLQGGNADSLQFRVRASNGSYRWFDNQVRPLRSKTGGLVAVEGMLIDITERRRAEEKIRENEATIHGLVEQSLVGVFIVDETGKLVYVNPHFAQVIGYDVAADFIGKPLIDFISGADRPAVQEAMSGLLSGKVATVEVAAAILQKQAATIDVIAQGSLSTFHGKSAIVGVVMDVTERKRGEDALKASESRWNFALEGAGQGVWDHDLRHEKAYFSPTWRRMRGIGLDEWVDPSRDAWLARVHPHDRPRIVDEADRQNVGELKHNSFEYRERHRDGHWMWILSRGRPVEWNPDGSVARIIGTDTDITSLKETEARAAEEKAETYRRHLAALEKAHDATEAAHKLAESMARHDPLTGLPNRRVFAETLNAAAARAARGSVGYAALMVDLDRFKPVNDVHGHAVGDEVLREIASRLGALARGSDTVARLGGDEFGFILDCVAPEEPTTAAAVLADRIIASVENPITVGDQSVEVGASIGIAICPTDGTDPETLLGAADMAMYRAKEDGRGTYRFFNQGMEKVLRARVALEQDVRRAVLAHDIQPHYQPLMQLAENRLVGFEILARWHHPVRGDVDPEVFIPVVEKLGLIGELTYFLLRRACLDARDWPPEITIAINVSPLHFADPLLPVKMLAILSETDFPPKRLEVEVTETALVTNINAARAALVALQDIGIKISLDDFGTGYSSLYNLRELHFDKVKIDRSFVLSMQSNAGSAKIVRSIIDLAKSLGLPTIAEGIEHAGAMQQIMQSGGEYGQGFYFGKAMPAAEATQLVREIAIDPTTRKKKA